MSVDWEDEGLLGDLEGKAREGRAELLDELHESGRTLEELRQAVQEGRLVLLPLEQALSGDGPMLTREEVAEKAEDLGYEVEGFAHMVRTPHQTVVIVMASGLEAGLAYGSHVHNQACDDGNAGGHYSFGESVPGGAGADGSELWPGPFVARSNGTVVGKARVGAVAGTTAMSVVIHAPGGAKIACADLR